MYRSHANYLQWIEKSVHRGEPIQQAKDRVPEKICQETRLFLDRVSAAGGKSEPSTSRPQGWGFLSEEVIGAIETFLEEEEA